MKKIMLPVAICALLICAGGNSNAQVKVGVFDIDLMVQAMPGYRAVDSLVQIYEVDSLGTELEYYKQEFNRLDSTYKSDSALVAQGKKAKGLLDRVVEDRRKMGLNLVYWQQIAQNKSNAKRRQLAQPLYTEVTNAYRKILTAKKYNVILKPNTYEAGFPIDNIFLSVARQLKLTDLPQELIYLGDDPDAPKVPAAKPPTGGGVKPKTN